MVQAQPQFTPKQILEAGQRAVAEGRIDYARQFFQHLIDRYADTPEAASARNEILSLSGAGAGASAVPPATAAPPLAANAPDLRLARPNAQPFPEPPRRAAAAPRPARADWPAPHRADPPFDRPPLREPAGAFPAERFAPERRPPEPAAAPPSPRALAPAPQKNYIAGRVFTGLLGLLGLLGLPLGIVMLYGVVVDPSLFAAVGLPGFDAALWTSLSVFLGSIALIILAQIARAIFDAADAASDLARLERYRLGLDDEDDD